MENSMVVNQDKKKNTNLNTIHLMCFLLHHRKRTGKKANWVNVKQDIFFYAFTQTLSILLLKKVKHMQFVIVK